MKDGTNHVLRRRTLALSLAAAPMALSATPAASDVPGLPLGLGKTYVLVHGAWMGGWFWAPVAQRLRAAGHRVFAPTQTGMGERRHLLSRAVTLDTFIEDVVNELSAEELADVILVGHSFGGLVVTGVADRAPNQIRRIVYLDAMIGQNGQNFLDGMPTELAAARRRSVQEGPAAPVFAAPATAAALGISPGPVADWLVRQMTPHPAATYETPLRLENPVGNGRPCTYVSFTSPAFPAMEPSRRWARSQAGWEWRELAAPHAAPVIVPDEVARLLAGIE